MARAGMQGARVGGAAGEAAGAVGVGGATGLAAGMSGEGGAGTDPAEDVRGDPTEDAPAGVPGEMGWWVGANQAGGGSAGSDSAGGTGDGGAIGGSGVVRGKRAPRGSTGGIRGAGSSVAGGGGGISVGSG